MKNLCALFVFLFLWCAAPSWATTFYVAKTGSDGNSCATAQTIGTPKLTITAGLTCLASGDTLRIRVGTYAERITQAQVPNGTSWATATTIAAYNSEAVIMKPASGTGHVVNLVYAGSGPDIQYIIFDGIVFDGYASNGSTKLVQYVVGVDGRTYGTTHTHHVRFLRCEVRGATASGLLPGRGIAYLEFIDNKIHDNGTDTNLDHGLYIGGSNHLIEGNEVYNNAASGIQLYSGTAGDTCNNNIIRRNRVHDNGYGIIVGSGDNNLAHNNIIYAQHLVAAGGSGYGISVYAGGPNGSTNAKLYNNTVYGNAGEGIQNRPGAIGSIIRNNISTGNTGTNINYYVAATNSNNLTTDPGFIAPGSQNFGLLATASTAIDQGFDLGSSFPHNGTAPDIGAHETFGFVTGSVPVTAPSTLVLNFENNLNVPLQPLNCAGFTVRKATIPNTIASCVISQNQVTLTVQNAFVSGNAADFTYDTTTGTVTDSAKIGNLNNQRLNAIGSPPNQQTVTNYAGAGTPPVLTQDAFRFECVGGTESTPDCVKPLNTGITLPPSASTRLRIQVTNTVAPFGASGYTVCAQKNGTGGYVPLTNGPCSSTGACFITGTGTMPPELLPGATTEQLAGAGTFVPGGVLLSSSQIPNVLLAVGQNTELLPVIAVGAGNSAGDYFDLRVVRGGLAVLDTYTQTPHTTIGGWKAQQGAR